MTRISNRLSALLLLLLCVYGQIYLLLDTLAIQAEPDFALWVFALCVLVWLAICFHRGLLWASPLVVLLLVLAYYHFATPMDAGLDGLLQALADILSFSQLEGGARLGTYQFVLLVFFAMASSYLAASLTIRGWRIILCLLGTLPIFGGCLAMNPTPPVLPIASILLFFLLLFATGPSYREDLPIGRTTFALLIPALLLLAGLFTVYSPEKYTYTEQDAIFSQQVDLVLEQLNEWIQGDTSALPGQAPEAASHAEESKQAESAPVFRSSWDNGEGELDLSHPMNVEGSETLVLRLRAEQTGRLYLRLSSYGEYTGTGWSKPLNGPVSSLSFTAEAVYSSERRQTHLLDLRLQSSLDAKPLPYYSLSAVSGDVEVPGDSMSYQVSYASSTAADSLLLPPSRAEDELLYREFAYDYYTRLPESTRSALAEICQEAGLEAGDPQLILKVASFVQQSGTYDLDTEPYPSADYALWFLTQARQGYCIHFATAAAAVYRTLGIPARVTGGFLVDAQAGRYVQVTGENAHAWVEVYRDGLGWLPVEVTGFAGETAPESSQEQEDAEPTPEVQDNDSQAPDESAPSPSSEGLGEDPQLPVGLIDNGSAGASSEHVTLWVLQSLVLLLVLLLVIALHYLLRRLIFRLRIEAVQPRASVIAAYNYSRRVEKFGEPMPVQIREIAEKAAFSRHEILKSEAQLCRKSLRTQIETVYASLSPWRKVVFRFLLGLC